MQHFRNTGDEFCVFHTEFLDLNSLDLIILSFWCGRWVPSDKYIHPGISYFPRLFARLELFMWHGYPPDFYLFHGSQFSKLNKIFHHRLKVVMVLTHIRVNTLKCKTNKVKVMKYLICLKTWLKLCYSKHNSKHTMSWNLQHYLNIFTPFAFPRFESLIYANFCRYSFRCIFLSACLGYARFYTRS